MLSIRGVLQGPLNGIAMLAESSDVRVAIITSREWAGLYLSSELIRSGINIVAVLMEDGGDVVHYFSPTSAAELFQALNEAVSEGRSEDAVLRRRAHAGTFSWQKTAQQFLDVIREVS